LRDDTPYERAHVYLTEKAIDHYGIDVILQFPLPPNPDINLLRKAYDTICASPLFAEKTWNDTPSGDWTEGFIEDVCTHIQELADKLKEISRAYGKLHMFPPSLPPDPQKLIGTQ